MNQAHIMKTSVSRNKGQVYSVGNYLMNGKVLGKGHFARVEEATHRIIGKKVAIKIIDLTCIKEEYARRNLHREPKVMARLRHPCIAALYETMMHGPRLYVVMEAACGGDLCAHVLTARAGAGIAGGAAGGTGGRGLPESRARALSAQLVSAVKHMHARGVVHRDLKMENIMLDSTKQFIKIVDFGLSNVWSSSGGLRTPCGSLEYAAPELFLDGRRYGPEVDLWSVGVIVYGMVTGALPFGGAAGCAGEGSGRSRPQLRAAIARGFSRKHRAALSAFSPECKVFVQQLLEPNVESRMKVEEAARHRWLRKPGMRLHAHPLPELELKSSRTIAKQISELSGQSLTDIIAEIKADPYGSVGGMYNIKTHTTQLQHAGSDMLWTNAPDTQPRPVSPPIYHPHSTSLFKHTPSIQSTNSTAVYRQGSPSHTSSPAYKQNSTQCAGSSAYRHNSPPSHTTNSTTIYKLNSPATQSTNYPTYKQPSTQPTHSPAIYKQTPSIQSTNSPAIYKQSPSTQSTSPTIYKQNPAQSTNSPAAYKQNSSISTNTPIIYKHNPASQSSTSSGIYKHPSTPSNSYKSLPPSPVYNPQSPSSHRPLTTKLRSPALAIRKPMYKVHDNGDGAEPRLPSIDEYCKLDVHDKYPRVKGRTDGEKLRLHSCPERTDRRAEFYRRAGDGLPSWRATGVTNTASARILLQSNATNIKRASLGNIVSPHSSSNSHCKSERAVAVGWFSSRNSNKDSTTPLQRLRRTAPIK